jgi:predicted transcriptional regulator
MKNFKKTMLAAGFAALLSSTAFAAEIGAEAKGLELRDANDKPATIPDFGSKVLAIFYTDADVADMNDPLADKLKEIKLDESVYRGLGIVNLKDSKAPNFVIRGVVRGKIEKYKSIILTDPNHALADGWSLGDCNNTSVIVVLGKDKKVRHVQRGPVRGKDIDTIVALIEQLMKE